MARKLHSRLKINGTLKTETALHVGGHGSSPDSDMPLAVNGKSEFYIPGTSIAGVLKAWCEKNFKGDANLIKELFGFQDGESGQASFVIVEDIELEDIQDEIRDGVGIDRYYGTAAERAKFDRAILPRGAELPIRITVEIQNEDYAAKIKAVFGHLLNTLHKGEICFGASKTRGLGRVKLAKIKQIQEQKFNDILTWLNSDGSGQEFTDETSIENEIVSKLNQAAISKTDAQLVDIKIKWHPKSALMVKSGYEGIGVDMLPFTSGVAKGELALCLPGSSIKGVLRSHAERIVRTSLDCEDKQIKFRTKGKRDFHEQIKALPLINELFGAKKEKDAKNKRLGLGALAIDDCYAAETMNAEAWRKVELARGDKPKNAAGVGAEQSEQGEVSYFKRELWRYLREIDERRSVLSEAEYAKDTSRFRLNHHVAIDRWTGGASEGALYSVLAPTKVDWEAMRLTLDFGRIEERSRLPALMLLFLTLRDVAENRLPFGFATHRGMGEIVVEKIEIEAQSLGAELKELMKFKTGGRFVELSKDLKDKLKEEWGAWRKSNQQL